MRAAPEVSCAPCTEELHTSIQVKRRHPTFPAQCFTAYNELSPENGSFASVTPERTCSQELDASTEASGPHVFAVRSRAVRYRTTSVHRTPSHVRGDHEAPL